MLFSNARSTLVYLHDLGHKVELRYPKRQLEHYKKIKIAHEQKKITRQMLKTSWGD